VVLHFSHSCHAVRVLTCTAASAGSHTRAHAYKKHTRARETPCFNAHALNRLAHVLARMVQRTDGDGGGADSLPLLDAVVELMRQQAEPELPPDPVKTGGGGGGGASKGKKKRGGGRKGSKGAGGAGFSFLGGGSDGLYGSMGGCDW